MPGKPVRRKMKYDALILGAGAAGLSMRGRSRHASARASPSSSAPTNPAKKILISGGGRCNFTNLHCGPQNFLSDNPDFCRSALARFTPADFLELVKKHKIPYHEKHPYPGAAEGQLFCDRSAADILTMLLDECAAAKGEIVLNTKIHEVKFDGEYHVAAKDANGEAIEFVRPILVVATGGLSIPKMGATGLGYEIAQQFGHSIVPCRPGARAVEIRSGRRASVQRTRRRVGDGRRRVAASLSFEKNCSSRTLD